MTVPMLERLSEYLYDPWIFWGVPLALALVRAGVKHARGWLGRHIRR